MTIAIGYVRVSTHEQVLSGLGLEAQRAAIVAECERKGWDLLAIYTDEGISGTSSIEERPGLTAALDALEVASAGSVLIIARLDRLARSLLEFTRIVQRLEAAGLELNALDLGVDTSTAAGKMLVNILATFAQFEQNLISERTKAAFAAKRARGEVMGPRPADDPRAIETIRGLRAFDPPIGWRSIAKTLDDQGIPTPGHHSPRGRTRRGKLWNHTAVQKMAIRLGFAWPHRRDPADV